MADDEGAVETLSSGSDEERPPRRGVRLAGSLALLVAATLGVTVGVGRSGPGGTGPVAASRTGVPATSAPGLSAAGQRSPTAVPVSWPPRGSLPDYLSYRPALTAWEQAIDPRTGQPNGVARTLPTPLYAGPTDAGVAVLFLVTNLQNSRRLVLTVADRATPTQFQVLADVPAPALEETAQLSFVTRVPPVDPEAAGQADNALFVLAAPGRLDRVDVVHQVSDESGPRLTALPLVDGAVSTRLPPVSAPIVIRLFRTGDATPVYAGPPGLPGADGLVPAYALPAPLMTPPDAGLVVGSSGQGSSGVSFVVDRPSPVASVYVDCLGSAQLRLTLDDALLREVTCDGAGYAFPLPQRLAAGEHQLHVESTGADSQTMTFRVTVVGASQ